MDWWITKKDRQLLGPVSTELLLEGIGAGKVPNDALVCMVGGTCWKSINDVAVFAAALAERKRAQRSDPNRWKPKQAPDETLYDFDDNDERTIAERSPLLASERPSDLLHSFDDSEEKTIVDVVSFRPSEPPE